MGSKGTCPLCKKSWDRCKCDLEKDFGIRLGNKEIGDWERLLISTEASVSQSKKAIEMNEYLIPFVKKRIEEEKKLFGEANK